MKILSVEDSRDMRDLISDIVNEEVPDCEFKQAINGVDGWYLHSHWRPDLVITDYQMPRMNGEGFATRIRESGETIPIILFSEAIEQVSDPSLFTYMVSKNDFRSLRDSIQGVVNGTADS